MIMRLVFMGTPDFAVPVLDALCSNGHDVVAVYTRPDRPAGRGRQLSHPPVKVYAEQHGIPVLQPVSLRQERTIETLTSLEPRAMVVAAYGRILPPEMLRVPPFGVLNVHPSLLPRYRGPSPVTEAILDGESKVGVTVMFLDEGMDTGPILAQRETDVFPEETADQLTRRLFALGSELLAEVLPAWEAGEIKPVPQNEDEASVTRLYSRKDGELDWSKPAEYLARRLRALHPWPGCFTHWEGRLLKVIRGRALEEDAVEAVIGQVVAPGKAGGYAAGVATGKGVLILDEVQLEGKRPQPTGEFLKGQPHFPGAVLSSRKKE